MNDISKMPNCTRVYQNHHLDSPRWERFEQRDSDIIITTAYKSGTTWTQTIVANLIFDGQEIPGSIMDISPWIDMRVRDFDEIVATTDAQQHRRFLKTHLPLDGIPFKEDVKYIYVGRDLRDVFMSLWNHYSNHTDIAYNALNDPKGLVGDPFPRCPDDIRELWNTWIQRGWFPWEKEGYPYFSSSHHAQTWWDYRHLPNILFIHFADLLAEPAIEIKRIADFLDITLADGSLERIVDAVSFKTMKADADIIVGEAAVMWKGGAKRFLYKGTNGRWHDVLTADDLLLYEKLKQEMLSPECADWLEGGRIYLSGASNP